MRIENLRRAGKILLREIFSLTHSPDRKTVLGTGAAGDKFFSVDKRAEEIILLGLTARK